MMGAAGGKFGPNVSGESPLEATGNTWSVVAIMHPSVPNSTISAGAVDGLNIKANLTTRKAYSFRTYEGSQTALYHTLGENSPSKNSPTDSAEEAKNLSV